MINIDLDIDMLRCFSAVAQARSFTKAGKKIGLTQSGVSVKIRRLEERLNTPVFNRSSKNLSLTFEGEILMEYAGKILSVHDEAVQRLSEPKTSGHLRVGLTDYFIPELLPSLLSRFTKQYPDIRLEVQTGVGIQLIPLFEKGELDIVVAGKDAYKGNSRILTQEPLLWVVGKDDPVLHQESIPLALLPVPCSFRNIATHTLEQAGFKWEVLFTGTSIGSIQAAVQAGIGISILPAGALNKSLRKAPRHLKLPKLPIYSLALISRDIKENSARDAFIRYLEMELRRLI